MLQNKPQKIVKITINASQLDTHGLFIVDSGSLELELKNDTNKKCVFFMFSYANAGNIKTNFVKAVEPNEAFPFTKEIKEDEAYGIKCTDGGAILEWKDLPVLIVGGKDVSVVHAEIKNGVIRDFETKSPISEVKITTNTKVWFVVKNSDKNYWSFDLIVNKKRLEAEGELVKIYVDRYWPPLKENQVLVLGPMSFKEGIYKAGLHDFYCKECPLRSPFFINSFSAVSEKT
ncbi:MAG: hypothetical protein QXM75_01350 [Candidatus Diapherotrites archaeon]